MKVSEWSRNTGLCALTEKVIFTDPYCLCDSNRWTKSSQLDSIAKYLREDAAIKTAAANLKSKFLTSTQALIHGDLHSGSVMVKEGSTFVIDPEFAFYGPMGFDIGAILANIALAYFAQTAYDSYGSREDYQAWLLTQMIALHKGFENKFIALWNDSISDASTDSEMFRKTIFNDTESIKSAQTRFMGQLWADTIGFMGMKMIRRIVGIAHVEDLECIEDDVKRADCEARALGFGIKLVLASQSLPQSEFVDINAVAAGMSEELF